MAEELDWNKDIMSDPRLRKIVLLTALPLLTLFAYFSYVESRQEQADEAARTAAMASQSPAVQGPAPSQLPTPDPKSDLVRLYAQARESFDGRSFENARDQAKAALDLAVKLNDEKSRLDCLELLADAAIARGRTDASLEYYKQLSPERYQVVLKRQVDKLEQAVSFGARGETERLAKLVCQMAELGKPNEASILKRAVAATQKAQLPQYADKLKGVKS